MPNVKDQVATSAIEEVAVPEVAASAEAKEAALLLENFMVETNKSLNTYRVKRELTFNKFKAAVLVYLDAQVAENKISDYVVRLNQSGAKKMGRVIVGSVTLILNDDNIEVPVSLQMTGWIESRKVILDKRAADAAAKAATTEEATA